jgi:hypothetical protein
MINDFLKVIQTQTELFAVIADIIKRQASRLPEESGVKQDLNAGACRVTDLTVFAFVFIDDLKKEINDSRTL